MKSVNNVEMLSPRSVGHILNVTREIDNFFPGLFDYYNIRVYDEETTDLLKYWDNTFKYITKARQAGSKVLVHCKMGVSRSASVVIAYAMKSNNWDFKRALQHVKEKRSCIKPNKGFTAQLETYQGILAAMRNKEKLQRSKSETNLKSAKDARLLPGSEPTPLIQALNGKNRSVYNTYRRYQSSSLKGPSHHNHHPHHHNHPKGSFQANIELNSDTAAKEQEEKLEDPTEQPADVGQGDQAAIETDEETNRKFMKNLNIIVRGKKEQQRKFIRNAEREDSLKARPRSWSQQFGNVVDGLRVGAFPMAPVRQLSQSLENILVSGGDLNSSSSGSSSSGNNSDSSSTKEGRETGGSGGRAKFRKERERWKFGKTPKTVRLPCSNGQNYSVSQNKIVHLTPESNNGSFLGFGSPGKDQEGDDEVELRRRRGMVSSVRLIVNEIESSNGTLGRGQRDKKAASLNLGGAADKNKLILKCDSSPVISQRVLLEGGEEEKKRPTVIAISNTGTVSIEEGHVPMGEDEALVEKKKIRLEGHQPDAFSKTVDRVFDREEKKQARNSVILERQHQMASGGVTTTTLVTLSGQSKDCLISRQSSWSSVDSACVMGGGSETNLRDLPSRHSSWGSGDTSRTTPSRNSSWGSYDMRTNPLNLPRNEEGDEEAGEPERQLEDVPWHPGTVRRTKQKIEAREKGVKMRHLGKSSSTSTASSGATEALQVTKAKRNTICGGALLICPPGYSDQLSVSAPSSSTSNSSCCSTYTAVNLRGGCAGSGEMDEYQLLVGDELGPPASVTGMVQNLKMNFEMGGGSGGGVGVIEPEDPLLVVTSKSLPSSPVATHPEPADVGSPKVFLRTDRESRKAALGSSSSEEEDHHQQLLQRVEKKNVKNLVGKYETTKVQLRSPDGRSKGGGAQSGPGAGGRQRPKSQMIPERKPMIGGVGGGAMSVTQPNSPAQRTSRTGGSPFNFNVVTQATNFTRPLMITHNNAHNKINKGQMTGIYGAGEQQQQQGKGVGKPMSSPRPPPVPTVTGAATVGSGVGATSAGQKNVLGNKLNVNIQEAGVGGGGGLGSAKVVVAGNLKKSQQGKTHPLTKLSFAFRQH